MNLRPALEADPDRARQILTKMLLAADRKAARQSSATARTLSTTLDSKTRTTVVHMTNVADIEAKVVAALSSKDPVKAFWQLAAQQISDTATKAASDVYKVNRNITGYRRVIHPEISKSGVTCGLCIAASQRAYEKGDLKKVHDNCHCAVVPIFGAVDPGLQLNKDDLKRLYEAADGTSRKKLSSVYFAPNRAGIGAERTKEGERPSQKRRTA